MNPIFAQEGNGTQSGPEYESINITSELPKAATENATLITDEEIPLPADDLVPEQEDTNSEDQTTDEEITETQLDIEEQSLEPEPLEELALMAPEGIEPANQTHGKYIAPEVLATDGSLRYEYPIVVPAGRNGLSPDLKLTYNSSDYSRNSLLADGWALNIPYIQRIHKNGVNKLYTEDYFISSLDGELVNQGAGVYVPRTEQGEFIKYIYEDGTWTLTDKSGTQYLFGSTLQARQANPSESNEVFAWMLEEVIDTNNNTISYSYFKNEGQIYPNEISYNQDAEFVISFNLASSSDSVITYSSGFKIKTNYHINRIDIEENSSLVSKVELAISDSQLNEISVTGYEDEIPFTLPSTEFLYTSESNGSGWDTSADYLTYMPYWNADTWHSVRFVDVNADGLPDIMMGTGVMINNGSTFVEDSSWEVAQNSTSEDWYFFNPNNEQSNPLFNVLDFNGDGLVDIANYDNNHLYIYKNNSQQYKVISEIKNVNHGSVNVTYTTAQMQDPSNKVHIIVPVVSSLEFDDQVGSNHSIEYEYKFADFYYKSHSDRRFSGFGEVTKINPDDTTVVSKYHQANGQTGDEPSDSYAKLGKVFEETVSDSSDDLYLRKRFNYEEASVGTNATSSLLQSVLIQRYDGTSNHVDTAIEYFYDSYGNIVTETHLGIVNGEPNGTFTDIGDDTRIIESVFLENETDYIVGLPNTRTFKNDDGNKEAQVNYLYDAYGNVLEEGRWIEGDDYATTSRTYNSYGLVVTESDPLSNTTTYTYDTNNLYPAVVSNNLSQETTYAYDYSSGKPKVVTDSNGKVIEYNYDGLDRLIAEKKTQGNSSSTEIVREFSYNTSASPQYTIETIYRDSFDSQDVRTYHDGFGREIQKKSELSEGWATVDTQYDNMGRVKKTSLPYVTSMVGNSNITTDTDLLVTKTHDALGRVVSISDARGVTDMEYTGFITVVTDAENNNKEYLTDAYENLVEVNEFNASSTYTTQYTYNTQNLLTGIVDAENNERGISYDGLGRRTELEDLHTSNDTTFGVWNFTYDDKNLLSQTDPNGTETAYTYDSLNRVLTEDNDNVYGTEVTYTYDSCTNGIGLLCGVSTPSATTTFTYLRQGVEATKSVTIDSSTYTTETTYNRQNQPVSITYPNSTEISYDYDIQGLPSQISKDSTVIASGEYGVHGKPILVTYANGLVTENTYDENLLYSLINKTTGFATSSATTSIITSTTTEIVPGAVVQELNDNLNVNLNKWIKSGTDNWYVENEDEVNVPGSISNNQVAGAANCDSPCYITLNDPLDLSTASSAQLTLWRFVDNDLDSGEYGQLQLFNGSNWVTVSSWADDNTWHYETYDLSDYLINNFDIRLVAKMSSAAETVQVDDVVVTVTYHDEIVTTVSTTTATTTLEGYIEDLQNLSYEYDAVGNIVTITDLSDTETTKIQSFEYDDLYRLIGVITNNVATGTSPYTQTFTYSPVGNITNFDGITMSYNDGGYTNPHAVTSVGSQSYIYSNNGNLTNDGVWTHSWDYKNRLVASSNGVDTTSYAYNYQNERIKLVEGGETTYYPFSDYEVTNGVPKLYLSLGDVIVATVEGATSTFIHTDHLGGTTLTTNASGTITQELDYYPFGDTRIDNQYAGQGTDRQFAGHIKDDETGLIYQGARYYASNRGQFISQDPANLDALQQFLYDPQQLNTYSYARNNPLKYIDPDGQKIELVAKPVAGFGNHLFYRVTPDNPDSISVNGVPAGTTEFTLGAYNPDGGNPFNNRLQKAIGCAECSGISTDFGEEGRQSITLNAPNGMSDTDFVNALGSAYNSTEDGQNYYFRGPGSDGYSNSNNFVYDIGSQVGIGDQVSSFDPKYWTPGNSQSLAAPNQPSRYQQTLNSIRQTLISIQSALSKEK